MGNYKVGDRVQIHPGTDHWMRGDRYGEVVYIKDTQPAARVTVKLDKSGRKVSFAHDAILEVVEPVALRPAC